MGCGASSSGGGGKAIGVKSFDFERVVGEGGFGKVEAATKKKSKPEQWYAIKKMSKRVAVDTKMQPMIMNERNLLINLHSKYLANIHYAFQDKTYCYL